MLKSSRKPCGAVIGLVVVSALIMVLIVYGLFQLSMITGGSGEIRNAIDAGALNVGKKVITLKTAPSDADEHQFDDCRDASGQIGLTNINRVWAKAFLVAANSQDMSTGGFGSGSASGHASTMHDAAQRLNNRIYDQLTNQNDLYPFFNEFASRQSVRMLGAESAVAVQSGVKWGTALVDRERESNIIVDPQQIPSGAGFDSTSTTVISGPTRYFKGYHAFGTSQFSVCLVPFRAQEMPHLISGVYFQQNTSSAKPLPASITNPLPNAYSVYGMSKNSRFAPSSAVAYAVANPQRSYNLAIPYGFVSIKLAGNTANWYVNGIKISSSSYGTVTEVQYGVKSFPIGTGSLNGYASLGNEYLPPTLWKAIYALPGDHGKVTDALVQRISEISPGYTEAKLTALLNAQPLIPGVDEYLIFPVYATPDATNPTIMVAPKSMAAGSAPWMKTGSTPDGNQQQIASEHSVEVPNTCWEVLTGTGCKPGPFWTVLSGELDWTPGTGYDQCLGQLSIKRTTDCYLNGACTLL